jgi:hypothetical protein
MYDIVRACDVGSVTVYAVTVNVPDVTSSYYVVSLDAIHKLYSIVPVMGRIDQIAEV